MTDIKHSLLYLLLGIGLVTAIDSVGSIVSRRLKFSYGYFAILSVIVYTGISYSISGNASNALTIGAVFLLGVYDSTVGWMISERLHAYYEKKVRKYKDKITLLQRLMTMLIFSVLCGWIGIWLASR